MVIIDNVSLLNSVIARCIACMLSVLVLGFNSSTVIYKKNNRKIYNANTI